MSKRGHWCIQAALRLYPELRQRYGTPDNRLTAQYTAQTSCGGAGRAVEQLAMERTLGRGLRRLQGDFGRCAGDSQDGDGRCKACYHRPGILAADADAARRSAGCGV